ncbi:hypothetical protein KCH_26880 [Kitasatospora cheerisanensis KCTC 2395]|uniref:Uncharacterized protein n=1 Tax=Kitasatospora cheerisanensis KCTC 2395 TaxID=1348663 RepID=A0A066YW28_9ACTN|nr:hypothetical protein KCH_26880 [Kitasatospora cheerisanensis KCTC 2395]
MERHPRGLLLHARGGDRGGTVDERAGDGGLFGHGWGSRLPLSKAVCGRGIRTPDSADWLRRRGSRWAQHDSPRRGGRPSLDYRPSPRQLRRSSRIRMMSSL